MSAIEDYPLTMGPPAWEQRLAMCSEIDRLRQWKAEALTVLRHHAARRREWDTACEVPTPQDDLQMRFFNEGEA